MKFFFENIPKIKLKKGLKKDLIGVIENENKIAGEISIIFCSDDYLLNINNKYLKHDYYTDVITFDYTEDNIISGDIFISIDRVVENAQNFNTDINSESLRVMVHGLLHLLGYEDKTKEVKEIMTKKEDIYIQNITK
jgi:probable rRNA maturation factor